MIKANYLNQLHVVIELGICLEWIEKNDNKEFYSEYIIIEDVEIINLND